MDIGQAVIAALMAIGQEFVVDAEQVQHRRIQVVDMDGIFDDIVREIVRFAVDGSWLDARSR